MFVGATRECRWAPWPVYPPFAGPKPRPHSGSLGSSRHRASAWLFLCVLVSRIVTRSANLTCPDFFRALQLHRGHSGNSAGSIGLDPPATAWVERASVHAAEPDGASKLNHNDHQAFTATTTCTAVPPLPTLADQSQCRKILFQRESHDLNSAVWLP